MIGGVFDNVNGTSRTRLARLNANGSLDLTYNPTLLAGSQVYFGGVAGG